MRSQAIKVWNAIAPAKTITGEGGIQAVVAGDPLVISQDFPFDTLAEYNIDFTQEIGVNEIEFIQFIYIDNRRNANPVTVLTNIGHDTTVKGRTQGWYPVMCGDPPAFKITSTVAAEATTIIFFSNVMFPAIQWATQ